MHSDPKGSGTRGPDSAARARRYPRARRLEADPVPPDRRVVGVGVAALLVVVAAVAAAAGGGFLALAVDLLHHQLVVLVADVLALDVGHNRLHLAVGDKAALQAQGFDCAQGVVEHVALADQLFGAGGV